MPKIIRPERDFDPLMLVDQMSAALARMENIQDILEIKDRADAVHKMAKIRAMGRAADEAKALQIRAEIKAGEWLQEHMRQGQRADLSQSEIGLGDLGIDRNHSHRWQHLAKLYHKDETEFEALISEYVDDEGIELTKAALLRRFRQLMRELNPEPMPDPVEMEDITIVKADVLELHKELPPSSIPVLLTDPPYGVDKLESEGWDYWGSEQLYWHWMLEWLEALRPKMARDYTAFIFCDAEMALKVHKALEATGWDVLRQCIWHRPNLAKRRTGSKTFLSSYEVFWHCGTRPLYFPEEWGSERFDVQIYPVPQSSYETDKAYHPTQKPLGLFKTLVEVGSKAGEVVLDPFCGAGTTAVAAYELGRKAICADIEETYIEISRGRLAKAHEPISGDIPE